MKLSISKSFSTILIIFIFSISIKAQQPDSSKQKITSLQKGSWSLQFAYNNYLGFDSFKGGNISAKYHFTENSALRFGVNLNLKTNKQNLSNNTILNDTSSNSDLFFFDKKNDFINISIVTDYVFYITTKKHINLFLSGGVIFGIGYSKEDTKNAFGTLDSIDVIGDRKINTSNIGINFSIGAEWFMTPNFSIHGEYQTSAIYQYSKSNITATKFGNRGNIQLIETVDKSFGFSPGNLLVGVSLYF